MPFILKLVIFWLCVFGIYFFVRRYPHSLAAKLLLSWQGPRPRIGETKSNFDLRYAAWAFRWFCQLAVVELVGAYVLNVKEQHTSGLVIFAFALPILAAMALLGSIGLLINAFVGRYLKRKLIFKVPPADFIADINHSAEDP